MPEYSTGREESDQSESNSKKNEDGPLEMKFELVKRALKLANEKF